MADYETFKVEVVIPDKFVCNTAMDDMAGNHLI